MRLFLLFHTDGYCDGEFLGIYRTMQEAEDRRELVWSNRNGSTTSVLYDKEDLVIRESEVV